MNKIVGILCIVNLGKCLINDNNKTMSRNNGIFLEFSPKYETIFCFHNLHYSNGNKISLEKVIEK